MAEVWPLPWAMRLQAAEAEHLALIEAAKNLLREIGEAEGRYGDPSDPQASLFPDKGKPRHGTEALRSSRTGIEPVGRGT